MKHRVMLVDDHCLFRKGLRLLVESLDRYEVTAEAANGREFLDLLDRGLPDVVTLDIAMPEMDGIEAASLAMRKYPDLKIITISTADDLDHLRQMAAIGVKGFLLKSADPDEVNSALQTVIAGGTCFTTEI